MYYIYRISNKVNGKTYIGQHKYKRLNDSYMGSGKRLWEAYRKYGPENFEKKILVFNISKREHADLLEKTFIAAERKKVGRENCYNRADGGDGGSRGFKGKHHSEESKKKLSEANKGNIPGNKGKHHSEEAKRKIAESNRGHPAWNKDKPMSDEQKKKLSEAHKEKKHEPHSEETKRKISEAMKHKHWKLVDGKHVYY